MTKIAQALHGYDRGHRLLAASPGVTSTETSLLDRVSDLTGYLPTGLSFNVYFSGFPCGGFYAFASTWLDSSASRVGTVMTHTLLIPLSTAIDVSDLWRFAPLHRRPASIEDRSPYETPLEVGDGHSVAESAYLDEQRAASAITLFFGQRIRPVYWSERGQPLDIVRYLWRLLWPEARGDFKFCTFALQGRDIDRRPFDFLAVPIEARGTFHAHVRNPNWYDETRTADPMFRQLLGQEWVSSVAAPGSGVVADMIRACRDARVELPKPADLPAVLQFLELRSAARERLSAARARADLLAQQWPRLDPSHDWWTEVLRGLVERQPDASMAPNPLWELTDLLTRPQVLTRATADEAFASNIERVVGRELERRLTAAPQPTASHLSSLLEAAPSSNFRQTIVDCIQSTISTAQSLDTAIDLVVAIISSPNQAQPVVASALAAIPRTTRTDVLRRVCSQFSNVPDSVHGGALQAAESERDPELAFAAWALRSDEERGLSAATAIVESLSPPEPQRLAALLQGLQPELILKWALAVKRDVLAPFAAHEGARSSAGLGMGLGELAERAEGKANGPRVFVAYANLYGRRGNLRDALSQHHDLALQILRLSLVETRGVNELTAFSASDVVPIELMLTDSFRTLVRGAEDNFLTRRIAVRVGAEVIGRLSTSNASVAALGEWLGGPTIRRWLAGASPWDLFAACPNRSPGPAALPRFTSAVLASSGGQAPSSWAWATPLLLRALDASDSSGLEDSVESLRTLLMSNFEESRRLAAEVLATVRRLPIKSGYRLAEVVFPQVYADLVRGRREYSWTSWWFEAGWDRAKVWRHWLTDTWVAQQWPEDAFLRCLGQDDDLFRRVARRAWRSEAGRSFICRVGEFLRTTSEFSMWTPIVRGFLDDPPRFDEPD